MDDEYKIRLEREDDANLLPEIELSTKAFSRKQIKLTN
jgi:hypothetical protein